MSGLIAARKDYTLPALNPNGQVLLLVVQKRDIYSSFRETCYPKPQLGRGNRNARGGHLLWHFFGFQCRGQARTLVPITSRMALASLSVVNGFCRKGLAGSSEPSSPGYPDMTMTLKSGSRDTSVSASFRPFMPGMTTSVSRTSMLP